MAGAVLLAVGSSSATIDTALFLAGAVVALGTGVVTMFVKGVR
jgi:hypothetical protein